MKFNLNYWLKISLINLFVVVILGLLMRYKIGFEFRALNQSNILHAHSHFAFLGWVTQTLYVLMIRTLQDKVPKKGHSRYHVLLSANLLCSYGMMLASIFLGWSSIALMFSMASILVAGFFMYFYLKDLKRMGKAHPASDWFRAALFLNIFSSLGTFFLAWMMFRQDFNSNYYLAANYFYLHFQYNGFFIFTCLGIVHAEIKKFLPSYVHSRLVFGLFALSVLPAYFLSVLWVKIPLWIYCTVVLAAAMQLCAWIIFLLKIRKSVTAETHINKFSKYLLTYVAIAFSLKLLLQMGSTIPFLSHLAFGFRPIVIAYLHLVLLAVITVFLICAMHGLNLIAHSRISLWGISIFSIGILLNEFVLGLQGMAAITYTAIPGVNTLLFCISALMFIAVGMLLLGQWKAHTRKIGESVA